MYAQTAFRASAASSWLRSLRGDHTSSSSRNATQSPRASASPVFRPRARPRCSGCLTTRIALVAERGQPVARPVGARVVHDDHLERHVLLSECAREAVLGEELPPVTRGNDDGYEWRGRDRANLPRPSDTRTGDTRTGDGRSGAGFRDPLHGAAPTHRLGACLPARGPRPGAGRRNRSDAYDRASHRRVEFRARPVRLARRGRTATARPPRSKGSRRTRHVPQARDQSVFRLSLPGCQDRALQAAPTPHPLRFVARAAVSSSASKSSRPPVAERRAGRGPAPHPPATGNASGRSATARSVPRARSRSRSPSSARPRGAQFRVDDVVLKQVHGTPPSAEDRRKPPPPPPPPPLPPPPPVGAGPAIGAQFHCNWAVYTNADRIAVLDKLQAAGVRWVRIDTAWNGIEGAYKGERNLWHIGMVDFCVNEARARGMKVLITLWLTPSWANGGQSDKVPPTNPQDYADFARWAATYWRGRVDAWEVWNEPDQQNFFNATQARYVQLLNAAYPGFKAGDPDAEVILCRPILERRRLDAPGLRARRQELLRRPRDAPVPGHGRLPARVPRVGRPGPTAGGSRTSPSSAR